MFFSTYTIPKYNRNILYFNNNPNIEFRTVLDKSSNIQKILSNTASPGNSPNPITLTNGNEQYDIYYNGSYFLMPTGKTSNGDLYVAKSNNGVNWTENFITSTSITNP